MIWAPVDPAGMTGFVLGSLEVKKIWLGMWYTLLVAAGEIIVPVIHCLNGSEIIMQWEYFLDAIVLWFHRLVFQRQAGGSGVEIIPIFYLMLLNFLST